MQLVLLGHTLVIYEAETNPGFLDKCFVNGSVGCTCIHSNSKMVFWAWQVQYYLFRHPLSRLAAMACGEFKPCADELLSVLDDGVVSIF